MSELALLGGPKTINSPFPPFNSMGREELRAAVDVIESGCLSGFFGSWSERFYGGPKVRAFEQAWADVFRVKHAVSFNSLTSGLMAAVGAIGIEPGDEIIVSPWTMCASATAILAWNAIPVFADIERETFNLDPVSVRNNITPYTRAVLVPDIFGHAAGLDALRELADRHNLKLIEDAAQAPYALFGDSYAGTVGLAGGFSLNYHKHIHTGEGGMMVTDDPEIAERMQLIRNHAEAVVGSKGTADLANMLGFNFRLGEIEAAVGLEQLKKLPRFAHDRSRAGKLLKDGLEGLEGLRTPAVLPGCTHVFYIFALTIDTEILGLARDTIVKALQAEGVPWVYGGYQNLHLLPLYQKRIAYGTKGFPWSSDVYRGKVSYEKGICPVAEDLHDNRVICLQICQHRYTDEEINLVLEAFHKIWNHLDDLRNVPS